MSTTYYSVLKKIFRAIGEHTGHIRALQHVTKMQLDHGERVDRTRDENFTRSRSGLKIRLCYDELNR
jgi:hypothetical protein